MTLHRLRVGLALAIFLGSLPALRAARLEDPRGPVVDPQIERRYALAHMRLAASDRLPEQDDEIAAYLAAQFNTIVLYDTEDGLLKSEERIAYEVSFARAHRLHIVIGKATEAEGNSQTSRLHAAAHRARRSLAVASAAQISDDEIRDRLGLWDRYGNDLILGVFFLHDDAFLI